MPSRRSAVLALTTAREERKKTRNQFFDVSSAERERERQGGRERAREREREREKVSE
jgi:hypothetical protein